MHNFKPGDLALIVGARSNPRNIGKIVECGEFLGPNQLSVWIDPAEGKHVRNGCLYPVWLVFGENLISWQGGSGFALIAPVRLMPLRGDEQTAPAKREELTV